MTEAKAAARLRGVFASEAADHLADLERIFSGPVTTIVDTAAHQRLREISHAFGGAAAMVGRHEFRPVLDALRALLESRLEEGRLLLGDIVTEVEELLGCLRHMIEAYATGDDRALAGESQRFHAAHPGFEPPPAGVSAGRNEGGPELSALFRDELAGIAGRLAGALAPDAPPPDPDFVRDALLTVRGSAAVLGRTEVEGVAASALDLLSRDGSAPIRPAVRMQLLWYVDELRRNAAGEHAQPAPAADESGDSLAETFADDVRDQLAVIERCLVQIEREPSLSGPAAELDRAVHTLKGAAATVGLEAIAAAAHRLEEVVRGGLRAGGPIGDDARAMVARFCETLQPIVLGAPPSEVERAFGQPRPGDPPAGAPLSNQPDGTDDGHRPDGSSRTVRIDLARLHLVQCQLAGLQSRRQRLVEGAELAAGAARRLRIERQRRRRRVAEFLRRAAAPGTAAGRSGAGPAGMSEMAFERFGEYGTFLREFEEGEHRLAALLAYVESLAIRVAEEGTAHDAVFLSVRDALVEMRETGMADLFRPLAAQARRLASDLGKAVEVRTEGDEVAVDRVLIDDVRECLLHLMRNAVDHGIEAAEERRAVGKPPSGGLLFSARRREGTLVIRVEDDGRGIDLGQVRERAVELGLLPSGHVAGLTGDELLSLVFMPGFSTRTASTLVSGRGIGMDVVRSRVQALFGLIWLENRPGAGLAVVLELPAGNAVQRLLLVGAGGQTFAVPAGSVVDVGIHEDAGADGVADGSGPRVERVGLAEILGLHSPKTAAGQPEVRLRLGARRLSLLVDRVTGFCDEAVRSLSELGVPHPYLAGVTLTAKGDLVPVVNVQSLFHREQIGGAARETRPGDLAGVRVLLADDSLTVRRSLRGMLEREGLSVALAADGLEAWNRLRRDEFDLLITDLEMPRMHGYDLIERVRASERHRRLPVLVITSRTRDTHRETALRLGADSFLMKPVRLPELLSAIRSRV